MYANLASKTYLDIGDVAFEYKGTVVISIFMYLELYLVAIEFLILESDNLNKLFPNTAFKIAGLKGKKGFVLLTTLVILPTTSLKSLGVLAYFSAGGLWPLLLWLVVFSGLAQLMVLGFMKGICF
jgi:vesicular inhibitory amino acid transporter